MFYMKFSKICLFIFISLICFSSIYSNTPEKANYIDITIAGDIMAHNVNFRMKDYNKIYTDILNITQNDDLTICNFETPVDNTRDYETYPTFNVKLPYLEAAVNAGFEVFTVANNHTNDQNGPGITETYKNFNMLRNNPDYTVYFSGIKENKNVKFSYELIDIKGWKVLFCGVTECINAWHDMTLIDFLNPTTKSRNEYLEFIKQLREENPCDVFIVAVHVSEPEYVFEVSEARKNFFHQLLDAGVDIVWGNHPHVTQEWEVFTDEEGKARKLVLYSTGNTISGQRGLPDYENPSGVYEYTGDSLLMELSLVRDNQGFYMDFIEPTIITTHVESNGDYVIKKLTEGFINRQSEKDRKYYTKRLELMKQIKGIENEL